MNYKIASPSNPFILSIFLSLLLSFLGCNEKKGESASQLSSHEIKYAKGFTIEEGEDFYVLSVNNAYPGSKDILKYLVLKSKDANFPSGAYDAIVTLPIQKVIVTSTTHIPHLDFLESSQLLIGFPNLNLITSSKTRALILQNKIEDLGANASTNIEKIISLTPDWVMVSTLGDEMSHIQFLNKAGIPTVINGEYTEEHPLGRAEWIKFTGVLLGKLEDAKKIFEEIEKEYLQTLALTQHIPSENRPTVLSGVMYKDTWFAPANNSWGGQFIQAAGGKYVFHENQGIGSLQLNYEYVLDNALTADFWIGVADFGSLKDLKNADQRYTQFKAYQDKQVHTYTLKKGQTGGLEYFELGYMRPDLILKDLIKILHPNLLPDYSSYFYEKLQDE
jgi:iron complex transport system substrate-binding protein